LERAHGLTPRFLRFAAQVARAEGLSLWQVLGIARRGSRKQKHRRIRVDSFPETVRFVVPGIAAEARSQRIAVAQSMPEASMLAPGKQLHARTVQISHDFYDAMGMMGFPERVRPLVSQPVIELCLRIPTYVLAADGIDRALVRRAFVGKVPRLAI
jgi:asparagine synthase (glutamine-hydrolysing)